MWQNWCMDSLLVLLLVIMLGLVLTSAVVLFYFVLRLDVILAVCTTCCRPRAFLVLCIAVSDLTFCKRVSSSLAC